MDEEADEAERGPLGEVGLGLGKGRDEVEAERAAMNGPCGYEDVKPVSDC